MLWLLLLPYKAFVFQRGSLVHYDHKWQYKIK